MPQNVLSHVIGLSFLTRARSRLARYSSENFLAHNFYCTRNLFACSYSHTSTTNSTAKQPSRWRPRSTKPRSRRTHSLRCFSSPIYRPWSCHSCPLPGWVCFRTRLCQHQLDQSRNLLSMTSVYQIEYSTEGNGVLRLKTIFSLKFCAAFDLRPAACTLLATRL